MKRVLCTICLLLVASAGCGGRDAYPVASHQRGDQNLTCGAIEREVAQNEIAIIAKTEHDKSKLWSNVFWLVWFPPLMDVKEAEKTEAEALQRRNNRLKGLWISKGCK